eukprot:gene11220-biopygen4100
MAGRGGWSTFDRRSVAQLPTPNRIDAGARGARPYSGNRTARSWTSPFVRQTQHRSAASAEGTKTASPYFLSPPLLSSSSFGCRIEWQLPSCHLRNP